MVICSTLNIRAFCAEMYACRQAEKFRLWSAKSIRTVIGKILALAKEKKYPQCYAEIYSFNKQSRKMFESIGFVQKDAETFVYTLE